MTAFRYSVSFQVRNETSIETSIETMKFRKVPDRGAIFLTLPKPRPLRAARFCNDTMSLLCTEETVLTLGQVSIV